MASELERLEAQIAWAFAGPACHGPSVLESIAGLTPGAAHAHPVAGAHSAWELLLHLAGTYHLVLRRLAGEDAPLMPAEDWPAVPSPTAEAWEDAIRSLTELNGRVRAEVLRFDPARLDEPLCASAPYTAHTQFVGITQHDLYHAGQIAILRKALGGPTAP